MSNSISFKTKAAILITIALWASAYVAIREGVQSYSPGGLALLRFSVASVCMFFIYRRRAECTPIRGLDLLIILFAGVVGIGIYHIALNYGEIEVPAGVASFIIALSPVITTLLAVIFLGERMNKYGMLGMVMSVGGVFLIALGEGGEVRFYVSAFYIVIAAFAGSVYLILQRSLLGKYSVIDLTAHGIWGGTLLLLIFTPHLIYDLQHAALKATLSGIYLGIFPGALGYLAWGYVLSAMPASRAACFLYFLPVVATVMGWGVLAEVPTVVSLVGGLVVLFGVWVVNQSYYHRKEKEKEVIYLAEGAE